MHVHQRIQPRNDNKAEARVTCATVAPEHPGLAVAGAAVANRRQTELTIGKTDR
jgi:hypothetical protein